MTADSGARDAIPLSAGAVRSAFRPEAASRPARLAQGAGVALLGTALLVGAGWLTGMQALVSIRAGWAPMSVTTAAAFMLLGAALFAPREPAVSALAKMLPRACAGVAGLLALAGLVEFVAGLAAGVDAPLPAGEPAAGNAVMSGAAASGILAAAVALLSTDWRTARGLQPSLLLAPFAAAIGLLGTIGHLYSAASLYAIPFFDGLALAGSLLLVAAAVGVAGLHPDQGLFALLANDGRGGRLARWLLPAAVVVPVSIGWAVLRGLKAGAYDPAFGVTVAATVSVLLLSAMTWVTAAALGREDRLRRRADEAQQKDAIRRRILFEQAKDGILILGPDHKVVESNASFSEMIGYPPAAVTRLHPWDWLVDSRTREQVMSDWQSLEREGVTLEARLRTRDGSQIDAEVSCTSAQFDGQPFLFLVCRDITQRKRSQHALHASEQRFRRALANIPDVVVIYDNDLRIQYVNNATRALTGLAPEALLGNRDEEVLPAEFCAAYLPALRKAFLTRQICAIESDIEMPRGNTRSLRITCVPLLDRDGEVREVLSVTRDFTDRRQAERAIRASEQKFRRLIEQSAAGVVIGDADGKVELVNSRGCELLGLSEAELLGRRCDEVLAPAEGEPALDDPGSLQPGRDLRFERRLQRPDGSIFPAEISINVLDSGAQQLTFQDITARYRQEQKAERQRRIQAMTSSINAAIVRLRNRGELLEETCRTAVDEGKFCVAWVGLIDEDGELELAAQSGLGESGDELLGEPLELVAGGASENAIFLQQPMFDNDVTRAADATPMRACATRGGAGSVISLPLIVEGETRGVIVLYAFERGFFEDEEVSLLGELAEDISFGLEFIAKEERVDYLAYYDTMTGLPNRSLFFNRLSRQLQDAQDKSRRTVLAVFDIDRFRMINDTYGRHEGDAVIAEVAQRLRDTVDEADTVARITSNTFAIALSDDWDAADIGHRLEELDEVLFAAAFRIGDEDVRVTATTGAAVFPDDARTPEELLGNAEAALRSAKSRSERCLLYSREMNERVAESLRFENRVRVAAENGELEMWYQPKVCSRSGRLRGLEALMRWKDPETGKILSPEKFIPVMEHTGCILEAGRWALQQVASDCLRWQERGVTPPRVAVNVSPIQLAQQNLVGSLVEAQIVANDAGTAIDLEITESVIMDDVDGIIPKLRTLASVGTRIHVDDFGTGYSSLAYIARLPIDALKIDRSFVSDLTPASEGLSIVRTIISLAKAMKLQVIAEGVETEEQVRLLRDLECDELQGFHIGRPLPPEETFAVIASLSGDLEKRA